MSNNKKSMKVRALKKTIVPILIFAWVFSGWPQIRFESKYFSIQFPPKIERAYAGSCSSVTAGTSTCEVPAGVTSVTVTLWGGGGGGAANGDGNGQDGGGGGGGGYVTGTLAVSAPITLSLYVGQGGRAGTQNGPTDNAGGGGGGGGSSRIWNGTSYVAIAGAGGGGGGGGEDANEAGGGGGGGGGANGGNGLAGVDGGDLGDGATTSAGGTGGAAGASGGTDGATGAALTGGAGGGGGGAAGGTQDGGAGSAFITVSGGAGGGGGGAFGGGGAEAGSDKGGGGGGGGSGKTTDLTGVTPGQGGQGTNAGAAGAAAGDTDGNYSGTVGDGGSGGLSSDTNGSVGNDGKIVISWTDPAAPTVSTDAATNVNSFSATLNGQITDTGGSNATSRGFAWGTNSTLSNGDTATTTETGSFGVAAFTNQVSGLIAGRTYYFRAYATNPNGTGFDSTSPILSFTASAADSTISRKMRLFGGFNIKLIGNRIILHQQ